jgi:transposase, IS5 family
LQKRESLGKKQVTRRQHFLAKMENYPKGEQDRPPVGLERTLRIYFLQQRYGLSDEGLEETLCDSIAMRARTYRMPPR